LTNHLRNTKAMMSTAANVAVVLSIFFCPFCCLLLVYVDDELFVVISLLLLLTTNYTASKQNFINIRRRRDKLSVKSGGQQPVNS
jgi:hypothetical protein